MTEKNTSKVFSTESITKYKEKRAIQLWILRILVEMGGNAKFIGKHYFDSNEIADFLSLQQFAYEDYDYQAARNKILFMYKLFNKKGSGLPRNTVLSNNIGKLAKTLSLSATESAILHFTVLVKTNPIMYDAIDLLGLNKPSVISRLYACCLKLDPNLVTQAFRHDGLLSKTGLLTIEPGSYYSFDSKVSILNGLIDNVDAPTTKPIEMFRNNFRLSVPAKLTKQHYPHLNEDVELLHQYLNVVHTNKKCGTNILVYGPPGVGKTEFAKMIAKLTKSALYEIGFEGKSGEPLKGADRFRAYKAAQNLINNKRKNIILFDEVEDVFLQSSDTLEKYGNNSGNKAWINKVLEENPVPAFWLTNKLSGIDKAFIRRFDYVIEMTAPPKEVRSMLLDSYLDGLPVTNSWKKEMSKCENLPPATIERASNILRAISIINPKIDADKSIHRIIGNSLEAMNMTRPVRKAERIELDYNVDMLNADCNIGEVSEGIIDKGQARICLYGPPGTGKSAFGRYIADMSGKQLLVKKASDIISPYVGESEQNMARIFNEAMQQNAVLLLDEADTYLQDRKNLQRSWEVSGVNEMLTQIEAFEGVFICSTNLMDSLDSAALRRFDLKIKFGHLNKSQAWCLFSDTAKRLSINLDYAVQDKLNFLNTLAPGDFATVLRQSRFSPIKDSWDLLGRLSAECAIKPEGNKHSIGFH